MLTRASGFNLRSVRQVSPEKIPTLNCSVSKSSIYFPKSRFKNAAMAPSNIVPHLTKSIMLFTYLHLVLHGFISWIHLITLRNSQNKFRHARNLRILLIPFPCDSGSKASTGWNLHAQLHLLGRFACTNREPILYQIL